MTRLIQLVLPGLMGNGDSAHPWIAERYPPTADELRGIPNGVRLARLVDDVECRSCNFGPYNHCRPFPPFKVCLRDCVRLGLWKPEDEEQRRAERQFRAMRTYRILHRPTKLWADVEADSVEDAVRMAGRNHPDIRGGADWLVEDCWVRQNTGKGWGKVREIEHNHD